jgi:predicted Mrr-cat superfamily restriction endonuclease
MSPADAKKKALEAAPTFLQILNICLMAFVSVTIWFVRSEVEEFHQAQKDIEELKQFQAAHMEASRFQEAEYSDLNDTLAEVLKLVGENQRTIGKLEGHLAVQRNRANGG